MIRFAGSGNKEFVEKMLDSHVHLYKYPNSRVAQLILSHKVIPLTGVPSGEKGDKAEEHPSSQQEVRQPFCLQR